MKLPSKIAFVDVETTGSSPTSDRIIEIGIVRVEDGQVTQTYETLVNPQKHVPPEIEYLTGIKESDLVTAPTFDEVIGKISELLSDCLFVAHNARFDYAFTKNEFRRHRHKFRAKTLCTVKLFRRLFPDLPHHNLDTVIEHFGIECEKRHRAYSDAFVLWEFYKHLGQKFKEDELKDAVRIVMKRSTIPSHLSKKDIDNLPEGPGVYIFYGEECALYIGKSVNLHDRVRSHFTTDYQSSTNIKIVRDIRKIEVIETAGEIGALIRESGLIKKIQPLYNRTLRRHNRMVAALKSENSDGYFEVQIKDIYQIPIDQLSNVIGVFKSVKDARENLIEIGKAHKLCSKLLGLENGKGPCFAVQIDKCRGACIGAENNLIYNIRFIEAFSHSKIPQWPYPGQITLKEEFEDKKEFHIVNNWCYGGSVTQDSEVEKISSNLNEVKFDWDIYKIIKRHLTKQKYNIEPLNPKSHYSEVLI